MNTWFEVKVKYCKVGEDGKQKKVSESFLFDAMSWTESEGRAMLEIKEVVSGDFVIEGIKKTKYSDVFAYDCGEWWFKVVINMISIDEKAGKEKEIKDACLVMADDIEHAILRTKESLQGIAVPYVISSVSVSNIVDIYPYFNDKED